MEPKVTRDVEGCSEDFLKEAADVVKEMKDNVEIIDKNFNVVIKDGAIEKAEVKEARKKAKEADEKTIADLEKKLAKGTKKKEDVKKYVELVHEFDKQWDPPSYAFFYWAMEKHPDKASGKKDATARKVEFTAEALKKMSAFREGEIETAPFNLGVVDEFNSNLDKDHVELKKFLKGNLKMKDADIKKLLAMKADKDFGKKLEEIFSKHGAGYFELENDESLVCDLDTATDRDASSGRWQGKNIYDNTMRPIFQDIFQNIFFGAEDSGSQFNNYCLANNATFYDHRAPPDSANPPTTLDQNLNLEMTAGANDRPVMGQPAAIPDAGNFTHCQVFEHDGAAFGRSRMEIVRVGAKQNGNWNQLAQGDIIVNIFGMLENYDPLNVWWPWLSNLMGGVDPDPRMCVVPKTCVAPYASGTWCSFRYMVLQQYYNIYKKICEGCRRLYGEELPDRILRMAAQTPNSKIILAAHSMGTCFAHILAYQLRNHPNRGANFGTRLWAILLGSSAHANVTFANYLWRKLDRGHYLHCIMEGDRTRWMPPIPAYFMTPTGHIAYFARLAADEINNPYDNSDPHYQYWQRFQIE
eukprot:CAMPEP_0177655060 /NCGR_PEP_ID=MMETSP0447-20121125/14727_1 /TAXON_ID=0 /ORGANISM="Stygamoeba regulata, Strain BSH-02190019" /LENGTH=581 /DNA_ID=CAMNT_0019158877 /DNA_START=162 /DNA_END=1907 /DNA_ORIENTATION=-